MSEPAQLGDEVRDWRLYVDDMIGFAETANEDQIR